VVQRYGGISLIVSASQRCSVEDSRVTVSKMIMGVGLALCRPGVKGDPSQGRGRKSWDVSVKQSGGPHRFEGNAPSPSRAGSREKTNPAHPFFAED
jgi:hypothetical protein